jgi:hypothetical protein
MKCLAKRPADRFQTGKQLADELHRWLRLEERVPAAPDAPSPPQSNLQVVAVVLVGLVLGLAFVLGLASKSKPREIAASPNPPVRKTEVHVSEEYLLECARRGIDPFEAIDRNRELIARRMLQAAGIDPVGANDRNPYRFGVRGR